MVTRLDDRQFIQLKRKLEALSYVEPLDTASAPLVQKLVDDLVHATESYRDLKLQNATQSQEIVAFDTKVCESPWLLFSHNLHLYMTTLPAQLQLPIKQ